jgi:hypothetical protein
MISKQYSQHPLLYLRKQCVGAAGTYGFTVTRLPLPRMGIAGRELNPRHADFQSFFGGLRGLTINQLQRLADPFPGTPRHNPGTPNLSWSRFTHEANEPALWLTAMGPLTRTKAFERLRTGGRVCQCWAPPSLELPRAARSVECPVCADPLRSSTTVSFRAANFSVSPSPPRRAIL